MTDTECPVANQMDRTRFGALHKSPFGSAQRELSTRSRTSARHTGYAKRHSTAFTSLLQIIAYPVGVDFAGIADTTDRCTRPTHTHWGPRNFCADIALLELFQKHRLLTRSNRDLTRMNMQISLKPLQQRCGSSPLLLPLVPNVRLKYQHVPSSRSPSGCASVVTCSRSDSHHQHSFAAPAHAPASIMFAAALALSNAVATDAAFAKTNPPKKSDPYEVSLAPGASGHGCIAESSHPLHLDTRCIAGVAEPHQVSR